MDTRIIALLVIALASGTPVSGTAEPTELPDLLPPATLPPDLSQPGQGGDPPISAPRPTASPGTDIPNGSVQVPKPATVSPPQAQQIPPTSPTPQPEPDGKTRVGPIPGTSPKPPTPPPKDHFGPPDDYWGAIGFLSYRFKSAPLGPAGVMETDPSGSRTLIGNRNADFGWASGLTLTGGFWVNDQHTFGVGLSGFLTGQQSSSAEVVAGPNQTLTRSFVNALTNEPGQFYIATPGFLAGAYRVDSTARLDGADAYVVRNLAHEQRFTIDLLAGFRYLDLEETLRMTQSTTPVGDGFILLGGNSYPAGTPLTITDRFLTRNQFYGGELGLSGEWRYGPACFMLTPKVGFGTVHETVQVSGESQVPGVTIPGGFFALPGGNAGRNGENRFNLLTEVRAEIGVYLTSHARLAVGYDFLYLNDVARPANQIDTVVNPRLVPTSRAFGTLSGVASPVPIAGGADFLAHGIRVSLEFRY